MQYHNIMMMMMITKRRLVRYFWEKKKIVLTWCDILQSYRWCYVLSVYIPCPYENSQLVVLVLQSVGCRFGQK